MTTTAEKIEEEAELNVKLQQNPLWMSPVFADTRKAIENETRIKDEYLGTFPIEDKD